MDENETYDIDELMNEALESDLLEATTAIQDTLTIGVVCASILSKYLHVRG